MFPVFRRISWSAESTAGPRGFRCLAVVAALAWPLPAARAVTGMVKGVVTTTRDSRSTAPRVTIEMNGGTGRKFETKTNKKGEYIQIGLGRRLGTRSPPKKTSSDPPPSRVTVRANVDGGGRHRRSASRAPRRAKTPQAKNAQLKKVFDEGVAAEQRRASTTRRSRSSTRPSPSSRTATTATTTSASATRRRRTTTRPKRPTRRRSR